MGAFSNELITVFKLITALITCLLQMATWAQRKHGAGQTPQIASVAATEMRQRDQWPCLWLPRPTSTPCQSGCRVPSAWRWAEVTQLGPSPLFPRCPGELWPADLLCSGEPASCRIILAHFYCREPGVLLLPQLSSQLGCKPLIC